MALNDGYAVDAQGRRIYFPPIGQPRLVPSTLDEGFLHCCCALTGIDPA